MKKASVLLVALALALFGLAACGDDDSDDEGGDTAAAETTTTETAAGGDAGGAGGTLDISTAEGISYDQDSLETAAGSVTVNYDNQADLSHDVVIEDDSGTELGKTDLVTGSQTSTTVDLAPGTYTFYCSVPGHREGGMEGTITVN